MYLALIPVLFLPHLIIPGWLLYLIYRESYGCVCYWYDFCDCGKENEVPYPLNEELHRRRRQLHAQLMEDLASTWCVSQPVKEPIVSRCGSEILWNGATRLDNAYLALSGLMCKTCHVELFSPKNNGGPPECLCSQPDELPKWDDDYKQAESPMYNMSKKIDFLLELAFSDVLHRRRNVRRGIANSIVNVPGFTADLKASARRMSSPLRKLTKNPAFRMQMIQKADKFRKGMPLAEFASKHTDLLEMSYVDRRINNAQKVIKDTPNRRLATKISFKKELYRSLNNRRSDILSQEINRIFTNSMVKSGEFEAKKNFILSPMRKCIKNLSIRDEIAIWKAYQRIDESEKRLQNFLASKMHKFMSDQRNINMLHLWALRRESLQNKLIYSPLRHWFKEHAFDEEYIHYTSPLRHLCHKSEYEIFCKSYNNWHRVIERSSLHILSVNPTFLSELREALDQRTILLYSKNTIRKLLKEGLEENCSRHQRQYQMNQYIESFNLPETPKILGTTEIQLDFGNDGNNLEALCETGFANFEMFHSYGLTDTDSRTILQTNLRTDNATEVFEVLRSLHEMKDLCPDSFNYHVQTETHNSLVSESNQDKFAYVFDIDFVRRDASAYDQKEFERVQKIAVDYCKRMPTITQLSVVFPEKKFNTTVRMQLIFSDTKTEDARNVAADLIQRINATKTNMYARIRTYMRWISGYVEKN